MNRMKFFHLLCTHVAHDQHQLLHLFQRLSRHMNSPFIDMHYYMEEIRIYVLPLK